MSDRNPNPYNPGQTPAGFSASSVKRRSQVTTRLSRQVPSSDILQPGEQEASWIYAISALIAGVEHSKWKFSNFKDQLESVY